MPFDCKIRLLEMMWRRVEHAKTDADTTYFLHLLYAGEFLTKFITAVIASSIADDREGKRYAIMHALVRADGIGEWARQLDEALIGPSTQNLIEAAHPIRQDLTEKLAKGSWQYDAVALIHEVLVVVSGKVEPLPTKLGLRQWFQIFTELRNKTRGHGATTPATCAKIAPKLDQSLRLIMDNARIFDLPYAYLHRNLSEKYRVVSLGGDQSEFEKLKTSAGAVKAKRLEDGIYIFQKEFLRIELIHTDVDVDDIFMPNGAFSGKTYELLSLISDSRSLGDGTPYLAPAKDRPTSETHGRSELDVVGSALSNIPPKVREYVARVEFEDELRKVLTDDRHPVISLHGQGGIGKTSLALATAHSLAEDASFEEIVWFSARDIDLMPIGPKLVQPQVLTQADISKEYVRLVAPASMDGRSIKADAYFASALSESSKGSKRLFIFDNFETMRNPGEMYAWLSNQIRIPNKILITTRHREFKADYPVEVYGMSEPEALKLIEVVSSRLGIRELLSTTYIRELLDESNGHPYIIKVLLGGVAKSRKLVKIERIVAEKDEILDALFERTFAGLSPLARRVFLTLCRWRSHVPQIAVEAVLMRVANEKMDVEAGVEELIRSSFVEQGTAGDGSTYLVVTMAASIFGRRKLEISPFRAAVEADVELLQLFGASGRAEANKGIGPRVHRLFKNVASRIASSSDRIEMSSIVPSLEFICRNFPEAWLTLAQLYEEFAGTEGAKPAIDCYEKYLEIFGNTDSSLAIWDRISKHYIAIGDWSGAANAAMKKCGLGMTPYSVISNTANWVNNLLRSLKDEGKTVDTEEWRYRLKELAALMEKRRAEANATDLSRLAWLHLQMGDSERARQVALDGLKLESNNEHCNRMLSRLRHSHGSLGA